MNGKLKALGLALLAVFAISAVAAGSASAENPVDGTFTYGAGLKKIDAEGGEQVFNTTAGELKCTSVSASTETFPSDEEITAEPTYAGCTGLGVNTHVRMNGCAYIFTANTTNGHAPVHIECPAEKEIEIKLTFLGERPCVNVPEQTPTGGGVVYDNETYLGSDGKNHWDVTITATVSGIKYTEVKGSLCGKSEETVVVNGGTYNGTVTVKGTDKDGKPVDITHHEA